MFDNMNLGARIKSIVVFLGLFILIGMGYCIYEIKDINDTYHSVYHEDAEAAATAGALGMFFNEDRGEFLRYVILTDSDERAKIIEHMEEIKNHQDIEIEKLGAVAISDAGKKMMAKLRKDVSDYRRAQKELLSNLESDNFNEKMALAAKLAVNIGDDIEGIYKLASSSAFERMETLEADINNKVKILVVLMAAVVITGFVMAVMMTKKIISRIETLIYDVDKISEGNLTVSVKDDVHDEIGVLANKFENMRHIVHDTISDIHNAAEQVAAGAKNISVASMTFSQGAAEQASSVEELSASIAEIASQTKNNAENAIKVNELTEKTKAHAADGKADMEKMLVAMEAINQSSSSISKIIKVIDEIAFQTNILALNAAVEAARAGQHGKGFAVVAEEVRNLAARSAKAAKETTDMIEGSINKVNDGRAIADETAKALAVIVDNIEDVYALVASIAKASKEQSIAIDQINQGVLQVSQVVQSNSATSEESASLSDELSAQANALNETASKFILDSNARGIRKASFKSEIVEMPVVEKRESLEVSEEEEEEVEEVKIPAKPPLPKKIALTEEEGFGKY